MPTRQGGKVAKNRATSPRRSVLWRPPSLEYRQRELEDVLRQIQSYANDLHGKSSSNANPLGDSALDGGRGAYHWLLFSELTWQDSERLCLRISERGGMVQAVWAYGRPMRTASNRMS
jgi:hypothetical protein